MSGSLVAALVVVNSIVAQPGEAGALKDLQGTWGSIGQPASVVIDGETGSLRSPMFSWYFENPFGYSMHPVAFEITSIEERASESKIEFSVAYPAEMKHRFPDKFHALVRRHPEVPGEHGEGLTCVVRPVDQKLPEPEDEEWPKPDDPGFLILMRVPPEHLEEYASGKGEWVIEAKTGEPVHSPVVAATIAPGYVHFIPTSVFFEFLQQNGPLDLAEQRQWTLTFSRNLVIDPAAKRAKLNGEKFSDCEYSLDGDILNVRWGKTAYRLTRFDPEKPVRNLYDPPPKKAITLEEAFEASWQIVRRWRRLRSRDTPFTDDASETWVVTKDRLTITIDGVANEFGYKWLDGGLLAFYEPKDPNKIVRYGRARVDEGNVLRIRLHPSIPPDQAPVPMIDGASRLTTTLYEFERMK